MRTWLRGSMTVVGTMAAVAACWPLLVQETAGQGVLSQMPRTADGKPDFSGVWQVANTAQWDLQDHAASQGPVVALGAAFSVPPGHGVVEGNEIPYQPWAAAQKRENAANRLTRDPEIKCYFPGVPRVMYMPYPFQILQSPKKIVMAFEFTQAGRTIYMAAGDPPPVDTYMGQSDGRWEGNTLVVDVSGFNDKTWFDRAGNFHSDALHVVERYTLASPNHILYEATIEDPKVFTRPWKISMPFYRRFEKDAEVLEYKCIEFAEELMYGHLTKRPN